MKITQFIASIAGIGYIRGGGTIAATVTALLWYLMMPDLLWVQLLGVGCIFATGIVVSNYVENLWGKDSNKIVIDEVLGMMISLVAVPNTMLHLLIAFIAFRFFDILKPLGVKKAEQLPAGWGVMGDDFIAGIYANILIHLISYFIIR